MSKRILKQVAGIDVAQNELIVSTGRLYDDLRIEFIGHKAFPNTAKGFTALVQWTGKVFDQKIPCRYVMEATGVYHERLAYFLDDNKLEVSIVLPNKISNYFRTLEVKTITDQTASEAILRFGLERNLDKWKRPAKVYRDLRQLSRERDQLVAERTMLKNQLHAEQAEAWPNKKTITRIKKRIELLNGQEKEIKSELNELIKDDQEIKKVIAIICTLPGVGLLTATAVLAETNGFDLIRNKRQLSSYAGLDVKEKESGTSVKGKSKISKRGNKYLRKAMHFPALTAIRHDERYKAIYARLISKHGIKMKAAVAVQRKLLEMIYTLYKTNTPYDKSYLIKHEQTHTDQKAA